MPPSRVLLLSGRAGIGKTTAIRRAAEFLESGRVALRSPILAVVANVASRGGGSIGRVKRRTDAELWEVTASNRDAIPSRICEWVSTRIGGR